MITHKKLFASMVAATLMFGVAGCTEQLPADASDEQTIAFKYETFVEGLYKIDATTTTAAFNAYSDLPDEPSKKESKEVLEKIYNLAPDSFSSLYVDELTVDDKSRLYAQYALQGVLAGVGGGEWVADVPDDAITVTGNKAVIEGADITLTHDGKKSEGFTSADVNLKKVDGEWLIVLGQTSEQTESDDSTETPKIPTEPSVPPGE